MSHSGHNFRLTQQGTFMNRSILSKMRTAALFALVASTVCQGQVDVIYTGRTLGYLRVPDQQDLDMQTCITDIHDPKVKDPAKTFLDSLTVRRNANSLTVGMGDNFGP